MRKGPGAPGTLSHVPACPDPFPRPARFRRTLIHFHGPRAVQACTDPLLQSARFRRVLIHFYGSRVSRSGSRASGAFRPLVTPGTRRPRQSRRRARV